MIYTTSLEAHPAEGKHSINGDCYSCHSFQQIFAKKTNDLRVPAVWDQARDSLLHPLHCALSSGKTVIDSQQRRAQWHFLWLRLCGELWEIQKQHL